ncbi:NERD domain-containing protein [Salinibacterium sp. SYSU T00001]|uniref:NERD domain-containing protein/DEAD/DEAH box helicase n=1 Tax=Homoserinimonas sedimenticola TaxID=2986805 RepID=UPI002235C6A5|nr:NERD domain-containing protein/DEAD/DEAH box helicase [Salinibacterium sedimenticola]MCW4386330.1 NERD domain-containing protein [Salinibacterium sedimenticola]
MVRMIPPYPRQGANGSERAIFSALEGILDRPDWVVIHSLSLAQNLGGLMGETDFIVVAPGKGILLIEAKSPKYVEYKAGDWYLDRTPNPNKDPLKQLEGARRSIRGFLRERELLRGDEPIARLLWFTSLGRHQFENKTPADMQFFEWELGWRDDLAKPAWVVEKVLAEHNKWFSEVDAVELDPEALTAERAAEIAEALVGDFKAYQSRAEQKAEQRSQEQRMLASQKFALELVEDNPHVYFDGPAGTGKSYLLAHAARRFAGQGKRVLVTCWNLLMAEELRSLVGGKQAAKIEIGDLNAVMLSICGLPTNPADADSIWYEQQLPQLTLERLQEKPYLGSYEAICVDEFQDIAGNALLLDVILALSGTGKPEGSELVFAGDSRQQILRKSEQQVDAYAVARERIADLVRVRVRRNCRTVPAVIDGAEAVLRRALGFTGHRVARSVPGGLEVVNGEATSAVASALKSLLEHHDAEDIVILSPFGDTNSTVGRFLQRAEKSKDERWLRKQLAAEGSAGKVHWRSIFKYKGLDADAVILTDLGAEARDAVRSWGLNWDDVMYVGLTRAKYRCVVVDASVAGV